jgi:integrase
MTPMERGQRGVVQIYVHTRSGARRQRTTGTTVPSIVRGMQRMVEQLKNEKRWAILEAIAEKRRWIPPGASTPRRFGLADAYPYYAGNQLAQLEGLLGAKNLADYLDAWIEWVRANRQEGVTTDETYWLQVTSLIDPGRPAPAKAGQAVKEKAHTPGNFPASELTKDRVKAWLTAITGTSGYRRKCFYALKSFVNYLLDANVYETDPLIGFKAPKKNRARERFESLETDKRIVTAAIPQYRAYFAFIHGIGCDTGSARRTQKGDVNLETLRVDIRGTKTDRRKVHQGQIEAWAIPYLTEHLKTIVGRHTLIFPGITNSGASHHHKRCCKSVGVEDYTLKDARHSVAIRMLHRGAAKGANVYRDIARQLGTSVYQAVTVYTKFELDAETEAKVEAVNG